MGCSLSFPALDVFFDKQGQFVIRTKLQWRFFVWPYRPRHCVDHIDVFDAQRYVWRVESDECVENALPIEYGSQSRQFRTLIAAQALQKGRRYAVSVSGYGRDASQLDFTIPVEPAKPIIVDRDWEYALESPETRAYRVDYERGSK